MIFIDLEHEWTTVVVSHHREIYMDCCGHDIALQIFSHDQNHQACYLQGHLQKSKCLI